MIILTIGQDWCSENALKYTLDILEQYQINFTFFATNESEILDVYRQTDRIEIGLHPNFTDLLTRKKRACSDYMEVIDRLIHKFPHSKSYRGHQFLDSQIICDQFKNWGFTHNSNYYIPYSNNIKIEPFRLWNEMISVPVTWEDWAYLDRCKDVVVEKMLEKQSYHCLIFHPVHLYFNTPSKAFYADVKKLDDVSPNRTERGVRDIFIELLELITERNIVTQKVCQAKCEPSENLES